jgi:hypothetical protein
VCGSVPIANGAVNANTITAVKNEKACHTIGSSRNRFSRGVNVVEPNCTTRNSFEYTMPMNGTKPAPTATSSSVALLVSTVEPIGIFGISTPSPTAPPL